LRLVGCRALTWLKNLLKAANRGPEARTRLLPGT
jgi:hypothetical protein